MLFPTAQIASAEELAASALDVQMNVVERASISAEVLDFGTVIVGERVPSISANISLSVPNGTDYELYVDEGQNVEGDKRNMVNQDSILIPYRLTFFPGDMFSPGTQYFPGDMFAGSAPDSGSPFASYDPYTGTGTGVATDIPVYAQLFSNGTTVVDRAPQESGTFTDSLYVTVVTVD